MALINRSILLIMLMMINTIKLSVHQGISIRSRIIENPFHNSKVDLNTTGNKAADGITIKVSIGFFWLGQGTLS